MPYHKLVHDRTPDIMAERGLKPVTRTLEPDTYAPELQVMLEEEVAEYCQVAGLGFAMER